MAAVYPAHTHAAKQETTPGKNNSIVRHFLYHPRLVFYATT